MGKYHRPGHAGVRRPAPQLAVDEIGYPPEKQSDRSDRGGDIAERQDRKVVLAAEQYHRGDAAQKAAMERHAALPQFENLARMLDEERQIVEQYIAGASAQDDADCNPENKIVHLQQRDRRRAAP